MLEGIAVPQHNMSHLDLYGRLEDLPLERLSVVDLGAGQRSSAISRQLRHLECRLLVSVEAYEDYAWYLRAVPVAAKSHIVEEMDMVEFARRQPANAFDVALMLDTLEHLDKDVALTFLADVERITQRRILIWLPLGECPQGAINGNPLELHRSTWHKQDLTNLGYTVTVYPGIHTHIFPDRGVDAAWAVKEAA